MFVRKWRLFADLVTYNYNVSGLLQQFTHTNLPDKSNFKKPGTPVLK